MCLCPLGYTGDLCETRVDLQVNILGIYVYMYIERERKREREREKSWVRACAKKHFECPASFVSERRSYLLK